MEVGELRCPRCGGRGPFKLGHYKVGCCICGADSYLECAQCGEVVAKLTLCPH